MSLDSPVAILYDSNGNPLAVADATAIPANTEGILALGSDGTNSHYILLDSSGRQVAVGPGVAGTPAGGVLSIQGVAGGQAVPVTGTLTITDAAEGTPGAAAPAKAIQDGGTDGTNLQAFRVFDLDTGAGTEYNQGVSLRLPASGGSVVGGTSSNPLRTDPTGTTTQPVSIAGSSAAALTNVASSATSVTILASNASRKGATVVNDSTKKLYLKFGTTASTTSFTAVMNPGDYYEVPFSYTGNIDGIWAAANGFARVTELT